MQHKYWTEEKEIKAQIKIQILESAVYLLFTETASYPVIEIYIAKIEKYIVKELDNTWL